MIDRGHALSVTKQAEVVGIARSTVYYLPRAVSAADLELMRRIDELHQEFPFAGARMLRRLLAADGSKIGRRHVKTLMQRMGKLWSHFSLRWPRRLDSFKRAMCHQDANEPRATHHS